MADNGIRTPNLPRDDGAPAVEVLVHADSGGGVLALRRQTLEIFVQRLLALAGLDPGGVAELSARLNAEIERSTAADEEFRAIASETAAPPTLDFSRRSTVGTMPYVLRS